MSHLIIEKYEQSNVWMGRWKYTRK